MTKKNYIFVGIDGGGSSTRLVLMNEKSEILGIGKSGPSSIDTVYSHITKDNFTDALENAWIESGIKKRKLDSIFVGLGGVLSDKDKEVVKRIIKEMKIVDDENVKVENDTRIALAGGLATQPGLCLIVGTGSVCYGRDESGKEWKAGGWGYKIDDPGSGYDIGRMALTYMVRAYDGREVKTDLVEAIFKHIGLDEINDVSRVIYGEDYSRTDIAALAPIVLEYAKKGDVLANKIIKTGVKELADMVEAVIKNLNFKSDRILMATIGGIAQSGLAFSEPLHNELKERIKNIEIINPILSPVIGAGLLALKENGIQISNEMIDLHK